MRVINGLKRLVFVIIRLKAINVFLRGLLKPFLPILPDKFVSRIPVVGKVYLPLPDSKRVLILASKGDDSIASSAYWYGLHSFEPETIDLYFHLLKHSQVVFDIGANTGLFALLAAVDSREREVHAFEPVPKIFNYLERNITVNDLPNLKAVCGAATNYDGEITLYIPHSITLPFSASTLKGFREVGETIVVPALKLDTYITTNNVTRVDLLKIDTEGTEHKVLEGAKTILERDKPIIICEVLQGLTETFLHSIFDDTEYKIFLITADGLVRKEKIVGDKYMNYLFITIDKIPTVLSGINLS